MKWVGVLLITLLLCQATLAAELHGNIYTIDLEPASNVLLVVNSTPQQRMLSTDGTYSFSLDPGTYSIVATFAESGTNQTSTETILITKDGSFVFDLFLLPDLDLGDDPVIDDTVLLDSLEDGPKNDWAGTLIRLLIVLVVIGAGYLVYRRYTARLVAELDDDAQVVLRVLETHGGRCTQKDVRKELPLSEAKVSLLISELEAKGKIEKIKKGRGNILILKK